MVIKKHVFYCYERSYILFYYIEEQKKANAVIFDDSDDELPEDKDGASGEKNNDKNPSKNSDERDENSNKESSEGVEASEEVPMDVQENTKPGNEQADPNNNIEALKKQQALVQFLKVLPIFNIYKVSNYFIKMFCS